jgi:secreted PhoX family phosphatase
MDRILNARLSRRIFLNASALAASGIVGFGSAVKAATAKVAKETVNYQASSRGPAHCAACAYFQAPSGCNFVNGPISPSGWCMLFKPK